MTNIKLSDGFYRWQKDTQLVESVLALTCIFVIAAVVTVHIFLPNIMLWSLTGSFDLCTLPARQC